SPDVGELLLAGDVHVEVVVAAVLADDHPFVDPDARRHEQDAALLKVEDGVRSRRPFTVGYHCAVGARLNGTVPWRPAIEKSVHHAGAARLRQKVRAKADETARGHGELQSHAAR